MYPPCWDETIYQSVLKVSSLFWVSLLGLGLDSRRPARNMRGFSKTGCHQNEVTTTDRNHSTGAHWFWKYSLCRTLRRWSSTYGDTWSGQRVLGGLWPYPASSNFITRSATELEESPTTNHSPVLYRTIAPNRSHQTKRTKPPRLTMVPSRKKIEFFFWFLILFYFFIT